jgi:hypothetical protein
MPNSKKIFVYIIIIGLLASLAVGFERHRFERNYKSVDITMDLNDLKKFSGSLMPVEELIQLKRSGLTSVAVFEDTPESMMFKGKAFFYSGSEFLSQDASSRLTSKPNPGFTYITVPLDQETAEIESNLKYRFGTDNVETLPDGLIIVKYPKTDEFMKAAVGFDFGEFEIIKQAGLNIIPRIKNHQGLCPEYIDWLFMRLDDYPISAVIFDGTEVLGFPQWVDKTAQGLKQLGVPFGLIETVTGSESNLKQAGMDRLAKDTGYLTTRVFSLSQREVSGSAPSVIIDKWIRSVERNNRIIYTRPLGEPLISRVTEATEQPAAAEAINTFSPGLTATTTGLKALVLRLTSSGFITGKPDVIGGQPVSRWLLLLVSLGAAAAGGLLLGELAPLKTPYLLGIAGALYIGIFLLMFTSFWITDAVLVALTTAVIFPALSMVWVFKRLKRPDISQNMWLYEAAANLLGASVITLVGALYTAALLSNHIFYLKLQSFRGVKASFVLPLVLVGIIYLIQFGLDPESPPERYLLVKNIKKILSYRLTIKDVVFLGIAGAIGLVYLMRSGNLPNIGVLSLELKFRGILENLLTVRPRTKEFLIGHPFMMLLTASFISGYRIWTLPFALLAVIGQVSILNTFSHLHIPLMTSITRTVLGLSIGSIVGLIVTAVFLYAYPQILKAWRVMDHE